MLAGPSALPPAFPGREAPRPPPFEELSVSTVTIMVYTNMAFHLQRIFAGLPVAYADSPLTRKQKNIDKKRIRAPYGQILSVQHKSQLRGLDLRKKKAKWCSVCQKTEVRRRKTVHVATVTQLVVPWVPGAPAAEGVQDLHNLSNIYLYCSNCRAYFRPTDVGRINHFLNQATVVLSLGPRPGGGNHLVNLMIFKDNLKLAGCRSKSDAAEVIMILWETYLRDARAVEAEPEFGDRLWRLKPGETEPKFAFQTVMKNVDFSFGFKIDRCRLNRFVNQPQFRDLVSSSVYNPSKTSNVNIKLFSARPPGHVYDRLVFPAGRPAHFDTVATVPCKKTKPTFVTFIVFSSSEVILTGRYDSLSEHYEWFVDMVLANRAEIEERLDKPKMELLPKCVLMGLRKSLGR